MESNDAAARAVRGQQPMTAAAFCEIGEGIYGTQWRIPLSRALGVNLRIVQRWGNGTIAIPGPIAARTRTLASVAAAGHADAAERRASADSG
jgi:hypothetical protein